MLLGSYEVKERSALVYLCVQKKLLALPPKYRVADKSLARPGRKQATAIEDFEFHISYL
jgi:hypothetical protein